MSPSFEYSLRSSDLLNRDAALSAIAAGHKVQKLRPDSTFTLDQDFLHIYNRRASHVKQFEGDHWQQLALATEEFVRNLSAHIGKRAEWYTIKGDAEPRFSVCRLHEAGVILGCMRVSSAHDSPDAPRAA